MPLVNDNFDAPVNPQSQPKPVTLAAPRYKGITVDSRYKPRKNLVSFVAGSKWLVNYYSQVLGADSGLAAHQLSRPGHLQSYKLIHQMLLRVTSGLTESQDASTKIMTVQGAGTMIAGVIGNVGDVFLADVGDGLEGYFEVTSSEKLTIYEDAAYAIEYSLIGYTTPEVIADLVAKTVESLYFRKDYMLYGQKPLITEGEMEYLHYFEEEAGLLTTYYFSRYFDDQFQTLTLPGQLRSVYDPYLVNAVAAHFSSDDAKELNRLRLLNVGKRPDADVVTLWEAMLNPKASYLRIMEPKMGLTFASLFPGTALMNCVRFSGISLVVYPVENTAALDNTEDIAACAYTGELNNPASLKIQATNDMISEMFAGTPFARMTAIPPVTMGATYLLSSAFYDHKTVENLSILEVCVRRHIRQEPVDPKALKLLMSTVYFWSELEKFYFIPLLLIMVKQYMITAG